MAQEPEAPPQAAQDEAQEEQEPVYPFFDVNAAAGNPIRVRAGWMTEESEVESIALDYSGPAGSAQDAIGAAFSWYVSRLQESARAAEAEQDQ